MRVLAIETSCDETAAAVVETTAAGNRHSTSPRLRGTSQAVGSRGVRVLSSVVASQADLHARTAGVVPEVAARAHVEAITYVIDDALRQAVGSRHPTSLRLRGAGQAVGTIDAIAVTTEPGLRPALIVGEAAARALAVAWDKPLIPVNHLAGHLAAAWIETEGVRGRESGVGKRSRTTPDTRYPTPAVFPIVALVVSGGHTQLWRIDAPTSEVTRGNFGSWQLTLLGQTRDDAAGEAFDKIARLLGLPYPGGAALAKLAQQGDACEFTFPRPMIDSGDLDFSFSGLKTAVYYTVRNLQATSYKLQADVAASAQEAIVDVLVARTVEAAAREGAREVILTGGVAANERLRTRLQEALGKLPLHVPSSQYCTDNAAMIGAAAVLQLKLPE